MHFKSSLLNKIIRGIEVVANQTVAQAEGAARANAAKASGESEAIKIITLQLRESPEYLEWQAITKWNGQMPYAVGSKWGSILPAALTTRTESNALIQILFGN